MMGSQIDHDSMEEVGLPCRAKLGYDTREATQTAISYAVWQYGGKASDYKVYQCKHCGRFHISRNSDAV